MAKLAHEPTLEEFLDMLRQYHKEHGKSPSATNWAKQRCFSPAYILKRFKMSWNQLLSAANLPLNHEFWDRETAITRMQNYAQDLGRVPRVYDFTINRWTPSSNWYAQHFGSFKQALFECGIIDSPHPSIEDKEQNAIVNICKWAEIYGKPPTVEQFEKNNPGGCSRRELEKRLGKKFNDIIRECLPLMKINAPKNEVAKQDIVVELERVKIECGRAPQFRELKRYGCAFSQNLIRRVFGMSYNNVLRSLGWEPSAPDVRFRDTDVLLDDFRAKVKQVGRIPYAHEMEGDIASYPTYVKYFGSIENVCKLLDIDFANFYRPNSPNLCADKNGELCRSSIEQYITNYLIDNKIEYVKETPYSEVILRKTKKRLDWVIKTPKSEWYVEYFGMWHKHPRGSTATKYNKRVRKKVGLLYTAGLTSRCIFIFPSDIANKSLDHIFEVVRGELVG